VRVVLPTASPGIFSAIMIGFGRAVGETMIVLMATGNTPIMDWPVQRLPHAVGEHRRRDPRGAARRHALPHAVPRRAAALRHDLRRQHVAELVRQRLREPLRKAELWDPACATSDGRRARPSGCRSLALRRGAGESTCC
jgi:hypothetical protein